MLRHIYILLFTLTYLQVSTQSESLLKQQLEGQRVEVLIEMPATKEGIDVHVNEPIPIDFKVYTSRLKEHGVALYPGDVVLITTIKKKREHIEFQLAGGGYGTFGDEDSPVKYGSRIPPSAREDAIEKILKDKSDEANRKNLEKEIQRLRTNRKIDQERLDREAELAAASKMEEFQRLRLQAGSRFNIRLDRNVESKDLTLKKIKEYLREYVSFTPGSSINETEVADAHTLSMAKGITWTQLSSLLGAPKTMARSNACGLDIMECTFEKDGMVYQVTLVEEVVVKYSIHSK